MKHINYGLAKFSPNPLVHYFKDLFRGLMRSTGNYPKSVWYSLRYNAGEKFILFNPYLYPYQYDLANEAFQSKEPVRLSSQLISSIKILQLIQHEHSANYLSDKKTHQELIKKFNESFYELFKTFEYNNDNNNFDVPVVVAARTLYASTLYDSLNGPQNSATRIDNFEIKKDTLFVLLEKFLEKVEFADADSISQVLHSLAFYQYYKPEIWNKIIAQLYNKHFEPEFTAVKPLFPKFFSYREVSDFERSLNHIDPKVNDLLVKNFAAVYEAYNAINKAARNVAGIDTGILEVLEKRIPQLKNNAAML